MAEGCYVDRYVPASYKGIPFEALEVTSEHGRRGAEGEFPFGENTAYADLGRRIRTYSIHGRFKQNDHIALTAALIAACELPGPGPLMHPTRGLIIAACKTLRITDNPTENQGVTEFDIDLVEAVDILNGLSLGGLILGLVLQPITEALHDSFIENYEPETVTFYDRSAVVDLAGTTASNVRDAFQQASSDEQNVKIWRSLAAFENVINDPVQLVEPEKMFGVIRDGMALVDKYADQPQKQTLFRTLINQSSVTVNVGRTAQQSTEALLTATRTLAAAYLARAILEVKPTDMDTAFAQYDMVTKVLDEELAIALATCDNLLYLQLSSFAIEARTALLDRAYNLPAIVEYQFPGAVPSLVAAHEIWSDATRFREIEQRNPSFWPWQVGPTVVAART